MLFLTLSSCTSLRQGLLSMANAGPDTNTSHFSLLMAPAPHLDGHYTIFGEVVEGFEVGKGMGWGRMTCVRLHCICLAHTLFMGSVRPINATVAAVKSEVHAYHFSGRFLSLV